ncbi:MAG: hypothetical protein JW943_11550, partial [Deltaproteobacteria bacterium]|nr:hypothetical protein [Deltaproteobacteria bacterium]
ENQKPYVYSVNDLRREESPVPAGKPENNERETDNKWKDIYTALNNEIKVRHCSPKTLRTYGIWTRKFQYFTKSKNPESLIDH